MTRNKLDRDQIRKTSKPSANKANIALRPGTPRQKGSKQNCRNKAKNSAKQTPLNDQKNSQIDSKSVSAWYNIAVLLCLA